MSRVAAAVLLATACALAGCSTRRTLVIDSQPGGARVWVDGVERGRAPVQVPFVHYGKFHVRLEKPGYASAAFDVHVPTEVDGYPLIDLPSELTVRAKRWTWTGTLQPLEGQPEEADLDALLERARGFRERTYREVAEPDPQGPAR